MPRNLNEFVRSWIRLLEARAAAPKGNSPCFKYMYSCHVVLLCCAMPNWKGQCHEICFFRFFSSTIFPMLRMISKAPLQISDCLHLKANTKKIIYMYVSPTTQKWVSCITVVHLAENIFANFPKIWNGPNVEMIREKKTRNLVALSL